MVSSGVYLSLNEGYMNLALPRKVKQGSPGELILDLSGKRCTSVHSEDQCIHIQSKARAGHAEPEWQTGFSECKNNSVPPQRAIL